MLPGLFSVGGFYWNADVVPDLKFAGWTFAPALFNLANPRCTALQRKIHKDRIVSDACFNCAFGHYIFAPVNATMSQKHSPLQSA
jgi:hypothetical protein